MADWGGYRKPSRPAQVSGPGRHARRTDGQPIRSLPNPDYGEQTVFQSLQQAAPLPQASGGKSGAPAVDPLAGVVGLDAPSQDPNMPMTAGADAGPGPGMEALGLPRTDRELRKADAQALSKYLPAMIAAASQPNSTPSFRRFVRRLIAELR